MIRRQDALHIAASDARCQPSAPLRLATGVRYNNGNEYLKVIAQM